MLVPSIDLVSRVIGEITFGTFATEFLENKRRKDGKAIAKNTKRAYVNYLNRCEEWSDLSLSSITLFMTNALLDELPASTSIGCRSFLGELFDVAISKGLVDDNPAKQTIKRYRTKQRKRHTLEGLTAIRMASPLWLQNAIDIAREHQQASVFLEVLTANTRAKKFYQNFAFTEKLSIDFKTDLYDIGMDLMQLELTSR